MHQRPSKQVMNNKQLKQWFFLHSILKSNFHLDFCIPIFQNQILMFFICILIYIVKLSIHHTDTAEKKKKKKKKTVVKIVNMIVHVAETEIKIKL